MAYRSPEALDFTRRLWSNKRGFFNEPVPWIQLPGRVFRLFADDVTRRGGTAGDISVYGDGVDMTSGAWDEPDGSHGEVSYVDADQIKCDTRLASIFGGPGAVVATATEPKTLTNRAGERHVIAGMNRVNPGGQPNPREDPANGVLHLYGSATGLGVEGAYAFTPPGYFDEDHPAASANPRSENEVQTNFVFLYAKGVSV
jgi:hypothetical protein